MVKKKVIKIKKEDYHFLKRPAIRLFGKIADRYSDYFKSLKISLITADTKILFRTYLSIIFFLTALVFILTFFITLAFSLYLRLNILLSITGLLIVPSFFASLTFLLYYSYPASLTEKRKNDIETNLPFALNHMAAVAESGVPPRIMFKVLSQFKDYGEISREAEKIARYIDIFGLDEITAIKDVASKTPSPTFKDFLHGVLTTIQTGGSLKSYLTEESEKVIFDYRIKRNKYTQQLSIYADFYTALLIAAPFIFIVILPILGILGGTLFGMTAEELIKYGIYSLVVLNIVFLAFINYTQPKM